MSELFKALAKAQGECLKIRKSETAKVPTKSGGSFEYDYASLEAVIDACKQAMSSNGLALVQSVVLIEGNYNLKGIISHASGETIEALMPMFFPPDMQKLGSSTTYARRYQLLALMNVAPIEDDDGAAACQDYAHKSNNYAQESKSQVQKHIGGQAIEKKHMKPTAPMMTRLWAIQKAAGVTAEQLDKHCFDKYECNTGDINSEQYDEICNALQKKIDEKKNMEKKQ